MKTILPTSIDTVAQAKLLLSMLHKNGEAFHPEDDATALVGDIFNKQEGTLLNKLMTDIYNLPGNDGRHNNLWFDPCLYLNDLDAGTPDSQPLQSITKITICGMGAHGTMGYESKPQYEMNSFESAAKDCFGLGNRLLNISSLINHLKQFPQLNVEKAMNLFFKGEKVEVKQKSKKHFQYWIPNIYIHVTID